MRLELKNLGNRHTQNTSCFGFFCACVFLLVIMTGGSPYLLGDVIKKQQLSHEMDNFVTNLLKIYLKYIFYSRDRVS